MRKKVLSILVLSILVASSLVGCKQPFEQPCTLIVYSITGGEVSVMKEGTPGWIEAEVGMTLEPGDSIKCSGSSNAEITFMEGSTIELETGTEIEVASLDYSADTGSATIRVKQTIGSIIFRVTKIVDPASLYEVETPTGVVAIRGSAMEVSVIEDGTTWVCNLEGDIWAIAQGVERQVPEDRCCVIRPGQPPKLICDLTISSSGGGSVTSPGEGTFAYDEGTVVDLVVEAGEGYHFGSWIGDVGAIPAVNATTTTITMMDNYSITANFQTIPVDFYWIPVIYYTLTVAVNGSGSTIPLAGQHSYTAGKWVTIFATPGTCYNFVNWTGDVGTIGNVNAASTSIIMNGDYSITANFEGIEVTFADPNLEAAVRDAIAIPTGPIYSSDLEGLTTLDASAKNITDLTGLECATSLTWLSLTNNQLSDISPLANLTGLTQLRLWSNQISDISPLANLTSLTYLLADYNQISDISPLVNLTSPTYLSLDYNQIGDIWPLASLTSLTWVMLSSNQISDIRPLANLSNMRWLYLNDNQISDIRPLARLRSLTRLRLGDNQISDISPLANLTSLTELMLWSNQISDISPLANLTSLTDLYLHHNQISDISPLANLTSLTDLYLHYNQISDISPLVNLTSLTWLYLDCNQISDISPLANLTSLTYLALGSNQISDVSHLANLTSLTHLMLWSNQISDISHLANLTSLTDLYLYYNQISNISPLANLTSLRRLGLHHNQISDVSPLVANPGLSAGDEVYLQSNPLSSDSINIYIPQLEARGVTVYY